MRILHLYHDLMNLYGDGGNVKAMCRHLKNQGFSVEVEKKTIGDEPDFSRYAFIYCGSGTERSRNAALEHFRKFEDSFKAAVKNGTVVLFTGNALEMLGKEIASIDGKTHAGLALLPFHVEEHADKRYTGDAIFKAELFADDTVGFVNKCSDLTELPRENVLFSVEMGKGNDHLNQTEGVRISNCFGTYLTGPICVKNPHVMRTLITLIGEKEYTDFSYIDQGNDYEKKSYEVTLKALKNRQ